MIKTVSLETAKALKEAGFRQDTELHWEIVAKNGIIPASNPFITSRPNMDNEQYSAPTTDELLEELPSYVEDSRGKLNLKISKQIDGFIIYYSDDDGMKTWYVDKYLPEALAKLWLWLKKENLIKDGA